MDKTTHLLNEKNIHLIKKNAIVMNASRGPVVSNEVLKRIIKEKRDIHAVLDVWETEPNYDSELLELVEIGTPHIAGYSYEGKVNGTVMIYDALSKYLGIDPHWKPELPQVMSNQIELNGSETQKELLAKLFRKSYSIIDDDILLRQGLDLSPDKQAEQFDILRKTYRVRRELSNFKVLQNPENEKFRDLLKVLRIQP